jgi:cellobiose phosphorylase
MVDFIFGLRKTYKGIIIQPNLPSCWDTASIKREYRGAVYHVNYERSNDKDGAVRILIDGNEYPANEPLPCVCGKAYQITVTAGKK